eukprot:15444192-Alexandrium_andersonii.AAC.1
MQKHCLAQPIMHLHVRQLTSTQTHGTEKWRSGHPGTRLPCALRRKPVSSPCVAPVRRFCTHRHMLKQHAGCAQHVRAVEFRCAPCSGSLCLHPSPRALVLQPCGGVG